MSQVGYKHLHEKDYVIVTLDKTQVSGTLRAIERDDDGTPVKFWVKCQGNRPQSFIHVSPPQVALKL